MDTNDKADLAPAPPAFARFTARFPKLGEAWELMSEAGQSGPLDERRATLRAATGH